MKRTILAAMLLTIGVCATIGFTHSSKGRQSLNTRLNTIGLPKQGLILIAPTDAYYKQVISTDSQNQTDPNLEALKPFSVLLKNNSNKALIAFKLKWEIVSGNDQVVTIRNGYMNSRRLFNVEDKSKTNSILEPNSASFCSVIGVADVNQLSDVQLKGPITTAESKTNDGNAQQASQGSNADTSITDLLARLSEAKSITVSVDGVLFEDGTFVGPDSSNFYGWLSSLINARKDLRRDLKAIQRSSNSNKVHERLEEETKSPQISLGPKSTSDDFYKFNRKRFAKRLLTLKNAVGDDAIQRELESSDKTWLNLRKL